MYNEEDVLFPNHGEQNVLVPAELGSARWVTLNKNTETPQTGGDEYSRGILAEIGPPWGIQPSMNSACREAGIDYQSFVSGMKLNRSDAEMAEELSVNEVTIKSLRERFYEMEALNGNTGISGM